MARPSQAITFPEVFLQHYGKARGFYPEAEPHDYEVDMGGDQYGWANEARQKAMDKVKQTRSAEHAYLLGVRPYQKLGLVRNSGGIKPFGINSFGGEFLQHPNARGGNAIWDYASEYEPRPVRGGSELRGGIMFTKAGQDYLQELLNKRQKEYAEMAGDREARPTETANTDTDVGDATLSAIYPLYDALVDSLRTNDPKLTNVFSQWWTMTLSSLSTLGSNYRTQIKEFANTLGELLNGYKQGLDVSTRPATTDARGVRRIEVVPFREERLATARRLTPTLLKLDKAIKLLWAYIGDDGRAGINAQYGMTPQPRTQPSARLILLRRQKANGMASDADLTALQQEEDAYRAKAVPEIHLVPIDAPPEAREQAVQALAKRLGMNISGNAIEEARQQILRLVSGGQVIGITDHGLEIVDAGEGEAYAPPYDRGGVGWGEDHGTDRLVAEDRAERGWHDAMGEFRPHGDLAEAPAETDIGLPPRRGQPAELVPRASRTFFRASPYAGKTKKELLAIARERTPRPAGKLSKMNATELEQALEAWDAQHPQNAPPPAPAVAVAPRPAQRNPNQPLIEVIDEQPAEPALEGEGRRRRGKGKSWGDSLISMGVNGIGNILKHPMDSLKTLGKAYGAVNKIQKAVGGRKPNARAEIVKKVMREKGLKMIEASKYVKAHGLY
jgi:hypothetical protein